MKIAILTLPLHFNYGGNLQCYALSTVLQRMGHTVINIKLVQDILLPPLWKRPYLYTKRLINKILGRKYNCIFAEQRQIKDRDTIQKYADEFINLYIPSTTNAYKNAASLEELNLHHFDAFIVGSDQVWRPKYAFPDIYTYFLGFLKNEHALRISYAASFGTESNEYSEEEAKECGNLIEKFDAISVREDSAIQLIKNTFGWKCKSFPQQVLDPTILLDKEDYLRIIHPFYISHNCGKLFYYILDMTPSKRDLLNHICTVKKLESFTVFPKSTFPNDRVEDKIIPPVEKWIQGFRDADIVVTDSFHGCVFSIIFNKPFIVYANQKRGIARFKSLLSMFNLENRLVTNSFDLAKLDIDATIDWTYINTIKEKKKQESISFLYNSLVEKG